MRVAITRAISPAINDCEVTHLARTPVDVERARRQHAGYERALADAGCRVVQLPPLEDFPDSVFVEDAAVVLDELAVIARPGAKSRRGETELIKPAIAPYRALEEIEAPGTLDGGDVLVVGRTVYVGRSARTNAEGVAQLTEILGRFDYVVRAVAIDGCLHLKTAATCVGEDALLVNPSMVDPASFGEVLTIAVDASEPLAANALWVGEGIIYPTAFPRTRERLESAGIDVVGVDADELAKAEGGVTCCSLVFEERSR